jgi:hypothetical protein
VDVDSLNSDSAREDTPSLRWAVIVTGLWALVAGVTAFYALRVATPIRFIDEFLFWAAGRNIAAGDGASWRGAPLLMYAQLYPLAIAPVFRLWGTVADQYDAAKVVGSVAISAVVIPTYLGARLFVSRPLALLAAVFSVAVPGMIYAGLIGTESFAYPLTAAALLATVWAIARPSWASAATTGILLVAAIFTRVQLAALIPVGLLAVGLWSLTAGPGRRCEALRSVRPLLVMLGAFVAVGLLYVVLRGRSSFGIYQSVLDNWSFSLGDAFYWLRAYLADVYLIAGILPAVATFALLGSRDTRKDPALRALLAVTIAAVFVLVAEVVWFALTNTENWRERHYFHERYIFYLAPLFFVGFVAAFKRADRRALAVSAAVAALVLALMPSGVILQPLNLDTPGQAWIAMLIESSESLTSAIGPILAAFSLLLSAAFALAIGEDDEASPVRIGRLLAVVLPLFFLVISQAKARSLHTLYAQDTLNAAAQPIDWAQRAADGKPVAVLYASGAQPITLYLTEFWNPLVRTVWTDPDGLVGSPELFSPQCRFRTARDGRILSDTRPGCGEVAPVWIVQSRWLTMRLRGGEPVIRPVQKQKMLTLQHSRGAPSVMYMRDGRPYVKDRP